MIWMRSGGSTGLTPGPGTKTLCALTLALCALLIAACGDDDSRASKPTPSPSPARQCCPSRVAFAIDGPATDFDIGAAGINFDTPLPRGLALDLDVACDTADAGSCGTCALGARPAERRCFNDASRTCDGDADCVSGRCVALFGPPIPLSAAGTPSCLLVELTALGPGTLVPATGETSLPIGMGWTLFAGLELAAPCPVCDGAALGAHGVCRGGLRDGAACVVGASDALLGNTSFDCPPNPGAKIGDFGFAMRLTTATATLAPAERCVGAPFAGAPCYCPAQTIANTCLGGHCEEDVSGEGLCAEGPADGLCAREPFRNCRDDAGCPGAGDRCLLRNRQCLGAAREIEGATAPLVRTGRAGTNDALLVALSCVPLGLNGVVNTGLGLPAALSLRMPVHMTATPSCLAGP
jgi:hypothetical protein